MSVYAFSTQDSPSVEKCSPAWICGSAMFTTVMSRMIMSCADSMMTRASPGCPRTRDVPGRRSATAGEGDDTGMRIS